MANNTMEDFFALHELQQIVQEHFARVVLVYLHTSQPNVITQKNLIALESGYLTKQVLQKYCNPSNTFVYLCGSVAMQTYLTEQLDICGISASAIETERFGVFSFSHTD